MFSSNKDQNCSLSQCIEVYHIVVNHNVSNKKILKKKEKGTKKTELGKRR